MSEPGPKPKPAPGPKVKRTADARLATLAPKRYDLETQRLEKLSHFLATFAPAIGEQTESGPKVDAEADPAIVAARDDAVFEALAAVARIAHES